jgi:gas vesicle protein
MDNKKMVKQMIDLHKTSFKNSFSTMVMLQNQAEKLMKTLVDHTPGISDEGKKVIDQWTDAYKKGIDDLKKAIDDGYDKIEAFFDSNAMVMLQDQTEKMFNAFLNQQNWMPQDLKKTMEELTAMYKKGCEDFKKNLDENIRRMENFYPVAKKAQENNKQKK